MDVICSFLFGFCNQFVNIWAYLPGANKTHLRLDQYLISVNCLYFLNCVFIYMSHQCWHCSFSPSHIGVSYLGSVKVDWYTWSDASSVWRIKRIKLLPSSLARYSRNVRYGMWWRINSCHNTSFLFLTHCQSPESDTLLLSIIINIIIYYYPYFSELQFFTGNGQL